MTYVYDLTESFINFPDFPTTNKSVLTTVGVNDFVVPAGVFFVGFKMWGGGGGQGADPSNAGASGGGGSFLQGILNVVPGETIKFFVAGGGRGGVNTVPSGGVGGGYQGGTKLNLGTTGMAINGGGGGGASWVFTLKDGFWMPVCFAGGGGGGGANSNGGDGGSGSSGQNGTGSTGGVYGMLSRLAVINGGVGTGGDTSDDCGGGAGGGLDSGTGGGAGTDAGDSGAGGAGAGAGINPAYATNTNLANKGFRDLRQVKLISTVLNGAVTTNAANNGDADYIAGKGQGGFDISVPQNGGDGLIVVTY